MKIRTDFVTNSSSSSFVVELSVNLKNGADVKLGYDSVVIMDQPERDQISLEVNNPNDFCMQASCDPYEYFRENLGTYEVPYEISGKFDYYGSSYVELAKIATLKNVDELISAITAPFGLDKPIEDLDSDEEYDEEYDEECDEYTNDRRAEMEKEAFYELKYTHNEMVSTCDDFFKKNLTNSDDIDSITLITTFCDFCNDEQLEFLFNDCSDLYDFFEIIDSDDMDTDELIIESKKLPSLAKYTDNAIKNIIEFHKADDTYKECTITQRLTPNGIELTIEG